MGWCPVQPTGFWGGCLSPQGWRPATLLSGSTGSLPLGRAQSQATGSMAPVWGREELFLPRPTGRTQLLLEWHPLGQTVPSLCLGGVHRKLRD